MDKIRLYFWRNLKFKSSVPQLPALCPWAIYLISLSMSVKYL